MKLMPLTPLIVHFCPCVPNQGNGGYLCLLVSEPNLCCSLWITLLILGKLLIDGSCLFWNWTQVYVPKPSRSVCWWHSDGLGQWLPPQTFLISSQSIPTSSYSFTLPWPSENRQRLEELQCICTEKLPRLRGHCNEWKRKVPSSQGDHILVT